jgi:uncharacterized protein YyaL (SSP411 family)
MNLTLLNYIFKDLLGQRKKKAKSLEVHLQAAMDWLCMAQDAQNDGGVSIRYSLIKGWMSSYPETTGYIIPTFFNYSSITGKSEYFQRAVIMAEWLLSIQKQDGSFHGGPVGSGYDSFVFDTGQIIFGLIAAYKSTKQSKYLESALKAGIWLVTVQESEGMWKKYTFHSTPHTYYSRVAWAIAELGVCVNDNMFYRAASKNIDWALTKQRNNGWFDTTGFTEKTHITPYTHTIAYTIEGILETGACLGRRDYIEATRRSADALCHVISQNSFCHGGYDSNWQSDKKYSCLTGNAQIALVLLRLYDIYAEKKYLDIAYFLNRFLCEMQEIDKNSPVRGAVSGSYPIWGRYERFAFPNWSTKFFVDSLILEKKIIGIQ